MEVYYSKLRDGVTDKVKVTCYCGECSLISTPQLLDLKEKLKEYEADGREYPALVKVIDNQTQVVVGDEQSRKTAF